MNEVKQRNIGVELRLSAQRALWGHVPPCLRTASISFVEKEITWRCCFDSDVTEEDIELLQMAGTEIIADFESGITIKEEMLVVPFPEKTTDFSLLVYYRHEHNYYRE